VNYKRRFARLGHHKSESTAEVRYRLHNEAEARAVADKLKGMFGPGIGFVLITCTYQDSARLLCEMLDHWEDDGTVTEPRVETATQLREAVYALRDLTMDDLLALIRECLADLIPAVQEGRDVVPTGAAALGLAALGVAVFDHVKRNHKATEEKGDADRSSN